jgi:sugar lactone lactonase YvrE
MTIKSINNHDVLYIGYKLMIMKKYLLFITAFSSFLSAQTISTFAGSGEQWYNGENLPATAANFDAVLAVAIDNNGELLVSEPYFRIRKVNLSGIISTFAGTGGLGNPVDNVSATISPISAPIGIAVNSNNDIIFCDNLNFRIRKIDSNGIITTIAGTGVQGNTGDNGLATEATIDDPSYIAVDQFDNIYFTEPARRLVRKISNSGIITTIAGTGELQYNGDNIPATSANIHAPFGVAVDNQGNVFIAECLGQRIRKINAAGIISTVGGTGLQGYDGDGIVATSSRISRPIGIKVDAAGNLYFADSVNGLVRKITPDGMMLNVAGTGIGGFSGDGGSALSAQLNHPNDIAFDAAGRMFIADAWNLRVRVIENALANPTFAQNTDITVFPNPTTNGTATILLPASTDKITITDILGREVSTQKTNGCESVEINCGNAGIYFINVMIGKQIISKKLIVE